MSRCQGGRWFRSSPWTRWTEGVRGGVEPGWISSSQADFSRPHTRADTIESGLDETRRRARQEGLVGQGRLTERGVFGLAMVYAPLVRMANAIAAPPRPFKHSPSPYTEEGRFPSPLRVIPFLHFTLSGPVCCHHNRDPASVESTLFV
jgi:hypothetical protein